MRHRLDTEQLYNLLFGSIFIRDLAHSGDVAGTDDCEPKVTGSDRAMAHTGVIFVYAFLYLLQDYAQSTI